MLVSRWLEVEGGDLGAWGGAQALDPTYLHS